MPFSEYYVDPSINADSGSGTIGDPYGDLQYALNSITRDSTYGDRINIKAGTAEVLTAALSLASYGSPSSGAQLIFEGYTSVAGDGGIGEINGGGSYACTPVGTAYFQVKSLKLGNSGSSYVVQLNNYCSVVGCEIHTNSANYAVYLNTYATIISCYIHGCTNNLGAIFVSTYSSVSHCYIDSSVNNYGIILNGAGSIATRNILKLDGDTSFSGIYVSGSGCCVLGNSIYSNTANTGAGVYCASSNTFVANNVIEGWSGTGGLAIYTGNAISYVMANAIYNCTGTLSSNTKWNALLEPNDTLDSSPFTNIGTGDFSINGTITGISQDAMPTGTFPGGTTANYADKGAVTKAAAGGSCDYPSEDDVRDGVTFDTYTGNLVLPDEADVESGVGYGTDGTEYTGTLVGGEGGGPVRILPLRGILG